MIELYFWSKTRNKSLLIKLSATYIIVTHTLPNSTFIVHELFAQLKKIL